MLLPLPMMVSRYRPSRCSFGSAESVIGAPHYGESVIGEGQYREGYHREGSISGTAVSGPTKSKRRTKYRGQNCVVPYHVLPRHALHVVVPYAGIEGMT